MYSWSQLLLWLTLLQNSDHILELFVAQLLFWWEKLKNVIQRHEQFNNVSRILDEKAFKNVNHNSVFKFLLQLTLANIIYHGIIYNLNFWKMDFDELHFRSISNLIFTACVSSLQNSSSK